MWYMTNVVYYDGSDAYVSKFIVKAERLGTDFDGDCIEIPFDDQHKIEDYLRGNGELLKIDPLYSVDFDNIVAYYTMDTQTENEKELKCAAERFKEMYFNNED